MSQSQERPRTVQDIVRRALPHVNEQMDWEDLSSRYDPDPEGNRLGMVLHDRESADPETGAAQVAEAFGFHVIEGPAIEIEAYDHTKAANPNQVFGEGDVTTYRDTALKVLNPDHDLTLQEASYQRGEVELVTADPMKKQMIWVVFSAIMEQVVDELDEILPGGE